MAIIPPRNADRPTPGPAGRWLVGSLPEIGRRGQVAAYHDWWRRHGDVFRVRLGPLWAYLVARPEDVRHVLVTRAANYRKGIAYDRMREALGDGLLVTGGEPWRRSRQALQPLFRADALPGYVDLIVRLARATIGEWIDSGRRGAAIDVKYEMMRLTMRVIGGAMLSVDVVRDVPQLGAAFDVLVEHLARRTIRAVNLPLWLPSRDNREFRGAIEVVRATIRDLMAARTGPRAAAPDVLDALLAACSQSPADWPEERILAELTHMFFAGYETTSLALFWSHWLLAGNPEVAARLRAETARALGDEPLTGAALPRLAYARAVVQEGLRLYPPVWIVARQANEPDCIAGHHVPRHAIVLASQYITHRHPEFWPDPEAFRPERFLDGASEIPSGAYFPFGMGQRMCLGDGFALQETTIVVALVAAECRWERVGAGPVEPWSCGTLHPRGDFRMLVRPA